CLTTQDGAALTDTRHELVKQPALHENSSATIFVLIVGQQTRNLPSEDRRLDDDYALLNATPMAYTRQGSSHLPY
ncbi:MAG: hypothetical protein ACREJ4_15245, partial [Candidatus Methylomirabilaceae bacterium]